MRRQAIEDALSSSRAENAELRQELSDTKEVHREEVATERQKYQDEIVSTLSKHHER